MKNTMPINPKKAGPATPAQASGPCQPSHSPLPSGDSTGPTPTEYGDRWEPLRSKLSIREAQYLNTYTRTGDIAALNALVLQIISERNDYKAHAQRLADALKEAVIAYQALSYQLPKGKKRELANEQMILDGGRYGWLTDAESALAQYNESSADADALEALNQLEQLEGGE